MSAEKRPLRILIAEDDPQLGEALRNYLLERGYQADLARHGGEALRLLEEQEYALVLADLVMPEADGLEVLKAARQRYPGILVVIMTGHASLASALKATREGAYDYLRKPFSLQEIDVALTNAARLLQLREENGRLLAKLEELNAKLAEMMREPHYTPGYALPSRPEARVSPSPAGRSSPFLWKDGSDPQSAFQRLLSLYQNNLLTEKEFQILKERISI